MQYEPILTPGRSITASASAAITGGQLVTVTGTTGTTPTVAPTTVSGAFIGVAAHDAATGDRVTVQCGGVQSLLAATSITAGDLVVSVAGGTVSTLAAAGAAYVQTEANASRTVAGLALTTAAAGARARVQMSR